MRKTLSIFLLSIFLSNSFQVFAESQLEIQKRELSGFSEKHSENLEKNLDPSSPPYIEGDVLVQYKTNLRTRSTPERALQAKGLKVKEKMKTQGAYIVSAATADKNTKDIIMELRRDPTVEYVQPNFIYSTESIPNDTNFQELWGLHNTGQSVNAKIGSLDADTDWVEADSFFPQFLQDETVVAVIDSGVNYNHEDLINQMWNGQNCVDQNGNTLGGCIHGYDFDQNDTDPLPDSSDHGTHVAGIIAAERNNGKGVTGIAPKTKIMAIKGFGTTAKAVDAINFAKQNGAKIINASWGGNFLAYQDCEDVNYTPILDMALYNAIADFGNQGGLFIAAAGNDNYNHDLAQTRNFPAGFGTDFQCGNQIFSGLDNIISVAASNSNDQKATFSDYGLNSVHVAAPGDTIKSTSEVTTYAEEFDSLILDYFNTYSTGATTPIWIENVSTGSSVGIADTFGSKGMTLDTNNPYLTGATIFVESESLDMSSYDTADINFWVDCDINPSENEDYLQLLFSPNGGQDYNLIKTWDNNESNYNFGLFGTGSGDSYAYDFWDVFSQDIDMEIYKTSNFKFRFNWVSDNDDVRGAGCVIDIFDLTGYTEVSQTSAKYVFKSGTSMAAPFVAGLASLVKSYDMSLGFQEVKDAILNFGDSLVSLANTTITGKRINIFNTLQSLRKAGSISIEFPEVGKEVGQNVTLQLKVLDTKGQLYDSYTGSLVFQGSSDAGLTFAPGFSTGSIDFLPGDGGIKIFTGALIFSQEGQQSIVFQESSHAITSSGVYQVAAASIPVGEIDFSREYTKNIQNQIAISSNEYPVSYILSGDITALSGSLSQAENIALTLNAGDGQKVVNFTLFDSDSNTSTTTGSIILDTLPPTANLVSDITPGNPSRSVTFHIEDMSSDTNTGSIVWNNTANNIQGNATTYHIDGISSNNLGVSVSFEDKSGNQTILTSSGYILDNTLPELGFEVVGGNISNTGTILAQINSSKYPVGYILTGDVQTLSGTLTESTSLPLNLTTGDGEKHISLTFIDTLGNTNSYTKTVILDTLAPQIIITSHAQNTSFTGSSFTLTGTVSDENSISSFTVNSGSIAVENGKWSHTFSSVTGGKNIISLRAEDAAGNTQILDYTFHRDPKVQVFQTLVSSPNKIEVKLETDIDSTATILYGSDRENLISSTSLSSEKKKHSFLLENLDADTDYFFKAILTSSSGVSPETSVKTIHTTKAVTEAELCNIAEIEGSLLFTGSTFSQSGAVLNCENSIDIVDNISQNKVRLHLQNFQLSASGSTWQGFFTPPIPVVFSGSLGTSGYEVLGEQMYIIGDFTEELALLGEAAEVSIFVGNEKNTQLFHIFHSFDLGKTYQQHSECIVTQGYCNFSTDAFSYFTLTQATDDVPDTFTFPGVTNAERSQLYTSETITVSGITKPTTISVNQGKYRINEGNWLTQSGTGVLGDRIQLQLESSSQYATPVSSTLSIGGVSSNFSVTTLSPVSTGGGGGGGGGSSRKDICSSEQLICQISGQNSIWVKKDQVSCSGGNLGKKCSQEELSIDLEKPLVLPKNISDILVEKIQERSDTLKKLSYISPVFSSLFTTYIENLPEASGEKVQKSIILEHMLFEKQYGKIIETEIDGFSYTFIEYDDTTLSRIQKILSTRRQSKSISGDIFEKEQRFLYLLSILVSEKNSLTLEKKKSIQGEAKSIYAAYKKEIMLVQSGSKKVAQIQEVSPKNQKEDISDESDIQTFTKKSVKLSPDTQFLYLGGWLKTGDTYRVLSQGEDNSWIQIQIVDSESEKSIGKTGYIHLQLQ